MEHVERQDEREQEIKGDLDELDHQAEQMDERKDELAEEIDEAREDLETNEESGDVPGAQPPG